MNMHPAFGSDPGAVGLGCNNFGWRLDRADSVRVVRDALDVGIRVFDTADTYGDTTSERALGEALEGRRDEAVLITKFGLRVSGMPDLPPGSPDYVDRALAGSLDRLRTDHVEVYLYHRHDGVTPWETTLQALARHHEAGRIGAVGLSGVTADEVREVHALCERIGVPLAAVENRYNLLHREAEADVLPACRELGVSFLPFYPLQGGVLTGRYRRGEPLDPESRFAAVSSIWPSERWLGDEVFDRLEPLQALADAWQVSMLELAIGSLAAVPGMGPVICGARTRAQLEANVAAGRWRPPVDHPDVPVRAPQ